MNGILLRAKATTRVGHLHAGFELLGAWTSRVIRARYRQSVLGAGWAVVQPAASAAIFSLLFTRIVPVPTGDIPYIVFSYSALVPWTLLASAVTDMAGTIVDNANLITKIYFPREVLTTAVFLARLVDFGIAAGALLIIMAAYRLPVAPQLWLYLPLIVVVQALLVLGLGMMGAALNVFYRDVKHVVGLLLQIWLYLSPVIYPVTLVPQSVRIVYYLNPMAGIIEAYRAVLLHRQAPDVFFWSAALESVVVFCAGYMIFKKLEPWFADIV